VVRKCVVASGVLIRDGRVLMIRHRRLGVYFYPGGHVENGETPLETVVREFEEEAGLRVEPIGPTRGINNDETLSRGRYPSPYWKKR
jgi:8-oxo-dGTP diphosphatase